MMMTIEAEAAITYVRDMGNRADLRTGLGSMVASRLREDALQQFQSGGDPAWPPLAESTVKAKRAMGYPRLNRRGQIPRNMLQNGRFGPENILMRTGALLSSWTQEQDPDHVEIVTEESVSTGSTVAYAGAHQEGKGVPKRAINVTDEAVRDVTNMAATYIVSGEETKK